MDKIFPSAVLEQSTEFYQNKIAVKSRVIYLSVIGLILLSGLALPFLYVNISIQAKGIMQSSLERNEIFVPVGGQISFLHLKENSKVTEGDPIAEIKSEQLDLELEGFSQKAELLQDLLRDLKVVLQVNQESQATRPPISFKTQVYAAGYYEFLSGYEILKWDLEKVNRDYERSRILFDQKVIPFKEFDDARLLHDQAVSNLHLYVRKQKAKWELERNSYGIELAQIKNNEKQILKQKEQYRIQAGVTGTLINVKNIRQGDFVFPNQKLGEISPDTTLLAIATVAPKDIAFIKPGQAVYFQMDAYNYNDWGMAKGHVMEVANDITWLSDKEIAFKVICQINQPFLRLRNGYQGHIKKGMSFNARFLVTRQSLFQLLYGNVNDWLNPANK